MNRLLIDYNNMAIRTLFSDMTMIADPNPEFHLHKHKLMASIFYNIRKFEPDEVVLAVDGKGYWRKKIYSEYKAHRKDKRDTDVFPWEDYYEYMDEFTADIKKHFPFKILRIDWVEADDIIGVLTRMLPDDKTNIIVTSDKDFIQLLSNSNVKLYDPMKREYVEVDDPKRELQIKIITGDKSDNIPNIKPRVGVKTAEKLLDDPDKFEALLEETYTIGEEESEISVRDNFKRNGRLIDMGKIPRKIQQRILDRYNDCEINNISGMTFMKFCMRNRLRRLNEDGNKIISSLKPLMGEKTEKNNDTMEFF